MFGVGPCPFGNLGQCGISEINKKVTLPTTGVKQTETNMENMRTINRINQCKKKALKDLQ
jgi:hypothetical protein